MVAGISVKSIRVHHLAACLLSWIQVLTPQQGECQSQKSTVSRYEERVQRVIESGLFENSKTLLDVGCGEGNLTAAFAARLPNVSIIGCDVSKALIDSALKQHATRNLSFTKQNIEKLSFSEEFDAVISFNCLHDVKNPKKAIEQIYRVLKPGGKAFLLTTPDSKKNDFKTICRSIILSFRWLPHFVNFKSGHSLPTEKEYKKMLKNAGFTIEKVNTKKTELYFKDRSELESYLISVLTPLHHLDPSDQPLFLNDFFKELRKQKKIDANGEIRLFFDQIEMLVSKPS